MKIKMRLLSETIFSSGEGIGNVVDIDVVYDKNGVPYIPSKRIKGTLRERAEELSEYGIINKETVYKIFGKSGEIESSLKLDNGYLKDYDNITAWIEYLNSKKKRPLSSTFVSEYFTHEISQTAIENGIAKKKSLRTLKTLRRGLEFYFDFSLDKNLIEPLEKIIKTVHHFGLSRSRGFGNVSLKIIQKKEEESSTKPEKHVQQNAIYMKIASLSPLMFYDPSIGTNRSIDFIPGSSLNGYFAWEYIKKYGIDEDFYDIFINGKVKFENLYKEGSTPTPFCLVREKDNPQNIFYLSEEKDIEQIRKNEIQTKEFPTNFISFKNGKLEKVGTKNIAVYHHSRPKNKAIGSPTENDGEFFQFEAIDKGEVFSGKIIGEPQYIGKLYELIKNKTKIRIGKSRTAQYGKVKVETELLSKEPSFVLWKKNESMIFYCSSDVILLNEYGFSSVRPEDFVKSLQKVFLKENLQLEKAFVNSKIAGGFLNSAKLPKPQKIAIEAGSVFKITNNSEDMEIPDTLYLGIRQSEGFGKIIVAKTIQEIIEKETAKTNRNHSISRPSSRIPYHVLSMIAEYLLDKKIDESLNLISHNTPSVSNNFISKLITIILEAKNFEDVENSIKTFKKKASSHLEKIASYIYINSKDKIVAKEEFEKIFEKYEGEEILANIKEKLFFYYKKYAIYILRQILYLNKL